MADDKVRRLSETLFGISEQGLAIPENLERILRAELKPLLDAAHDVVDADSAEDITLQCGAFVDGPTLTRLAAELRNWRKE